MIKRLLHLFLLLFISLSAFAQTGTLRGIVKDTNGITLPFATVLIQKDGTEINGTQTDVNGVYTFKALNPGQYDVLVSYIGYATEKVEAVQIAIEKITFLDFKLVNNTVSKTINIKKYKLPLIDPDFKSGSTKTFEDIIKSPLSSVSAVASTTAGVYTPDDGSGDLNVRGARSDGTLYYVDGVKLGDNTALPKLSLEQVTVITGGMPARYGDATGGVVSVTTRNATSKHEQGISLESSQFLDHFGYNNMEFYFMGPLYYKKEKSTFLGYSLIGQLNYTKDPLPSAVGAWKVKDDVLTRLQQNPLQVSQTGIGTVRSAEYLTADSLEYIKTRQNAATKYLMLNARLEYRANKKLSFYAGGNLSYSNGHDYIYQYSLLNSENNPYYKSNNWRVYGRMVHKIGVQNEDLKSGDKSPLIKNAYYTLQTDYNSNNYSTMDDTHGKNLFDYGYIGQFQTTQEKNYVYDSAGVNGAGYYMQGWQDKEFTLLNIGNNATASRYTQQYYEIYNGYVTGNYENYDQVQKGGALLNGDRPQHVYDILYSTGRQSNGYGTSQRNQFRLIGSIFADIKNHELNAGFEYEQRLERSYSISPMNLWTLARQLGNAKNTELDKTNPIINGDTTEYNRLYVPTIDAVSGKTIKGFFENVRTSLNKSNTDFVDIDNLKPSDLSLDMFSADELMQNGNGALGSNYGYDYLGNPFDKKAAFADFFNATNDDNAMQRNVPGFNPIYIAGYLQDKFTFKDMIFNVGLRLDRYDANQMVPRDLYSLYPIKTAAEARAEGIAIPSSVGDDYKVYIDDIDATNKTAVGFRDENNKWYNSVGTAVSDPAIIASSTKSGSITPYLVNPKENVKSSNFNVDGSFKKYEAQYVLMPRISFSFPISTEAIFFAHYDVLSQRPGANFSRNNPLNYLFMENSVGAVLNNPGLKPQKTTDYELGFAQKISRSSALTISAFYRDIKDMIQLMPIQYAYPVNYLTFGNIDFGTVKGMSFTYEQRRVNNVRMLVNYTLQFAEGTGSNATSSINILNSGSPNLRTVIPLDYDRRHNINFEVDYRYGRGKTYNGPGWGRKILADFGVNFLLRTGSGTPYSRQSNITQDAALTKSQSHTLSGQPNGSRLPWSYRMDVRIDKDFILKFGDEKEKQKITVLNAYFTVNNLLNTRNIVNVYRLTGNAADDGFLSASVSQQEIDAKVNAQSFIDLYSIVINSPYNYSMPRTLRLGVIYNF